MRPLDEQYLDTLRAEFPGLNVVYKADDRFSKAVDKALRVLTLGGQSAYMTRYVTTISRTLYLPSDWEGRTARSRYVTLRHEAVHLRQFRRYGLLPMALIYLVPLFPVGLAWGRARLEWEAYAEGLRARAEVYGLEAARDREHHAHLRRQFTGPAYGWMWPFDAQVQRWIDTTLEQIALED